jgi:hypothetical protein
MTSLRDNFRLLLREFPVFLTDVLGGSNFYAFVEESVAVNLEDLRRHVWNGSAPAMTWDWLLCLAKPLKADCLLPPPTLSLGKA